MPVYRSPRPHGLDDPAGFSDFALSQFGKRAARLEKARTQSLDEVLGTVQETEEAAV